jgi:hypothetical protein
MARGSRSGKTEEGSHEYVEGRYTMTRMGDDRWYIFSGGHDQGVDFASLGAARAWCKLQRDFSKGDRPKKGFRR